jgi:hypothetical protein
MRYRSLLMRDGQPPVVSLSEKLLVDYTPSEIGGMPVFAGPAPWRANHDLLIDDDRGTLAGIVYPVAAAERAAVANLCSRFPNQLVRYCVSPMFAADMLEQGIYDLDALPREWGDPSATVEGFPEPLRPIRQLLRECLAGRRERSAISPELMEIAARHFREIAKADYFAEWPGGDVDRVEIVWAPKSVLPGLPPFFPSALRVELAQHFAEDIWLYGRDDGALVGFGLNHLDELLEEFGLELPSIE